MNSCRNCILTYTLLIGQQRQLILLQEVQTAFYFTCFIRLARIMCCSWSWTFKKPGDSEMTLASADSHHVRHGEEGATSIETRFRTRISGQSVKTKHPTSHCFNCVSRSFFATVVMRSHLASAPATFLRRGTILCKKNMPASIQPPPSEKRTCVFIICMICSPTVSAFGRLELPLQEHTQSDASPHQSPLLEHLVSIGSLSGILPIVILV